MPPSEEPNKTSRVRQVGLVEDRTLKTGTREVSRIRNKWASMDLSNSRWEVSNSQATTVKCTVDQCLECPRLHLIWITMVTQSWLVMDLMGSLQACYRQLLSGMEWCLQDYLECQVPRVNLTSRVKFQCTECRCRLLRCMVVLLTNNGVWIFQLKLCKCRTAILAAHLRPYHKVSLKSLLKSLTNQREGKRMKHLI